jgi:hypothetical protein
MCFFKDFYDNFLYNTAKTSYKWHAKMIIRHSPLRRAYNCIVSSLQSNYIDS